MAPSAERYGFEFGRSTTVRHIDSPTTYRFFCISACTGCAMSLYTIQGVDVSWLLGSKDPSLCIEDMLLTVISVSVTPSAPSATGTFLSSNVLLTIPSFCFFECCPSLGQSCRILSELQLGVNMGFSCH